MKYYYIRYEIVEGDYDRMYVNTATTKHPCVWLKEKNKKEKYSHKIVFWEKITKEEHDFIIMLEKYSPIWVRSSESG